MEIKIKYFTDIEPIKFIEGKSDWYDLRAAEDVEMKAGEFKLIKLGVAMQLPKGYEALMLPRSGTFDNYGIMLTNGEGVIDYTFCGNDDEWKFGAIAFKHTEIKEGDRICQFRIQLSQKATMWQKLKWLFDSKINLIEVSNLRGKNRGGFSSTGVK